MEAAGAIDVSAATLTADAITGHQDITLAGAATVNGQVLGGGDITISGSGSPPAPSSPVSISQAPRLPAAISSRHPAATSH
ncbi:hypothetical protein QA648_35340 (plasmid) [Rhizobium sp. CB3171]|uniref:hypothetical protein n=1 Tax=Rhizobium sp. CB3171 TaxID=3039157 RepID=UPI0024B14A78|nr:hypothetical protein [Rhizobium sp. CB3171]WFU07179.1 hypothetical protein QA648_35340 [Rhizobium sp. CB3171]